MLYPLTFHPILKPRPWGGRKLQELYQKLLLPTVPIGESWEISDRPGDISVIANGPLAGKDLHWLLEAYGPDLLGSAKPYKNRFPLLIKILDARQTLSLQVHPPADRAAALGGEPKTEMWYITEADPGAELYVGLKRGSTRRQFEDSLRAGRVQDCFHQVPVGRGNAMFLPSGRVHALGAGLVLFEIQQNSDTTYRVFDWNRVGLDGKPRQLHIKESLQCIDFHDFEPGLITANQTACGSLSTRVLVRDPLFEVEELVFSSSDSMRFAAGEMRILGVVSGQVTITNETERVTLLPGQFCLIPASVRAELCGEPKAIVLHVRAGAS